MLKPITKGRTRLLGIVTVIVFAVIIAQLFRIQILDHELYRKLADDEAIKQLVIPAKRGLIYMRDMDSIAPVVLNEQVFLVFVDPMVVTDASKVEEILKKIAGGNLVIDIREALSLSEKRSVVVARDRTRTQAEMIKQEDLAGVGFTAGVRRVYPEANLAGQVLGFVNSEGKGQYGIEQALNDRLAGQDGILQTVTDINNVPLTLGDNNVRIPATDGDNIVLSIDRNAQAAVEAALKKGIDETKADMGSAVVLNPKNGQILAMANFPNFNPAEFDKVEDAKLFQNAVTMDPYEPGSVIKAFTMTAGLDSGTIRPDSMYNNKDVIFVEDRKIENSQKGYLGPVTMQEVLNQSLNTGVVTILMRMGDREDGITSDAISKLYNYFYGRFHFGRKTEVEVAENPGIIVSPEEQEGNAVRYSNMTFGQGMNINMLSVANAFSALVNGGRLLKPTLIAGVIDSSGQFIDNIEPEVVENGIIQPQTSSEIQEMLVQSRATAFSSHDPANFRVGGKTGTSEVLVDGSYTKSVTVASYLGFGGGSSDLNSDDFGADYVIMVRLGADGKNLEGGKHAEPVFADISNWMSNFHP